MEGLLGIYSVSQRLVLECWYHFKGALPGPCNTYVGQFLRFHAKLGEGRGPKGKLSAFRYAKSSTDKGTLTVGMLSLV